MFDDAKCFCYLDPPVNLGVFDSSHTHLMRHDYFETVNSIA
jgi:hypothetical protein